MDSMDMQIDMAADFVASNFGNSATAAFEAWSPSASQPAGDVAGQTFAGLNEAMDDPATRNFVGEFANDMNNMFPGDYSTMQALYEAEASIDQAWFSEFLGAFTSGSQNEGQERRGK